MSTIKISVPFPKHFFDKKGSRENRLVCGIDEVGRGCLAGPVVAAALMLKPKSLRSGKMPLISDSKVMTPEEREAAFAWLIKNS